MAVIRCHRMPEGLEGVGETGHGQICSQEDKERIPYEFAMSGGGERVAAATLSVGKECSQWHWRVERMRR